MDSVLHITNGNSADGNIRESGIGGDVLPWRDVLHEGPVPTGVSLDELSRLRANYLADAGAGEQAEVTQDFVDRHHGWLH